MISEQNSTTITEIIIFIGLPTGSEFWDNSEHRQIRLIPNNSVREIHIPARFKDTNIYDDKEEGEIVDEDED